MILNLNKHLALSSVKECQHQQGIQNREEHTWKMSLNYTLIDFAVGVILP
jgi:hypothetical protein